MNNNDNYKTYQQGNLFSINGSAPITNLYNYPCPLISANIVPNIYGTLQNSNKNVAQIGYNPTLPNTNKIQTIYNPVNTVSSFNMKNQIVLMNNMNIIQTKHMNKNNETNIFTIGNNNFKTKI